MKIGKIKVELIDKMGSDHSVVNAARVSFDKEAKNYGSNDNSKLIKYLATHNHWTPFSHAFASFRVAAPIFVSRQLAKHTVGLSWNEVSRRYVSSEPEFYLPDYWRKSAPNVKQGSSDEAVNYDWYDVYKEPLEMYTQMLDCGVCPEQARMVLPQSMITEWIWSGSLYAFARVCNLRLDSHTQKETQEVAKQIDAYMIELFPESWSNLVKA
jgi:thymidylate synthase (FAD)